MSGDDRIYAELLGTCKSVASELENVGKEPKRYCHDCKSCVECPESGDAAVGTATGYHCLERSELDDDAASASGYRVARYFEVDPDEETSTYEGLGPCGWYEPGDDADDEESYESMHGWLEDQLDIEYTVTVNGEYKHGTVTACTGGPHVEVDTRSQQAIGWWGSTKASASVSSDAIALLDEALEETYESVRGG